MILRSKKKIFLHIFKDHGEKWIFSAILFFKTPPQRGGKPLFLESFSPITSFVQLIENVFICHWKAHIISFPMVYNMIHLSFKTKAIKGGRIFLG